MKHNSTQVQDLYLEQAAVDELGEETWQDISSRPGFSPRDFDAAVDRLKDANTRFLQQHDTQSELAEIRRRAFAESMESRRIASGVLDIPEHGEPLPPKPKKSFISRFKNPGWSAALAAALPVVLVLGLVFRFALPMDQADPAGDGIRTKGLEPRIFIYRDLGDGDAELLEDGDRSFQGDNLQISYLATGKNYGAIISVDSRDVITLHYPENSDILPRLQPYDEVYLPYGYRLDDAPQFERFFFVSSEEAFDVGDLLASIAPQLKSARWTRSGELDFPEEFSVHRIDLVKPAGR
ncbi:hypothetical protein [Salinispira pacifica]|uniref:ActD n=1 Tax=Salinispira pacifica TaxID=1307761 RepID=V5WDN8_9SPIO|nr:hypothetical protein [Salinispira pacifica]AHC13679.1 ActD [Salinispira pacifica]